jgi:predicted AAA+ superfamily ATPase
MSAGAESRVAIASATKISPRHVSYALRSAEILGFVRREDDGLRLTNLASTLLAADSDSADEKETFAKAIKSSLVVQSLAPTLLNSKGPSRAEVATRIRRASGLSRATAERRAQTLFAWRKQILDSQVSLFVPKPSRSKNGIALELPKMRLSDAMERDLLRDNPWWQNRPGIILPQVRRDFVSLVSRRLDSRLAPIVVVRGPRQVGKTTAQLQIISDLLERGVPNTHILRVQFDELSELSKLSEPILRIVDWYEDVVLKTSLNEAAKRGSPAYLFFDEVQNLSDWAIQLKHLVDGSTAFVVVTGSSALRIEQGRDSLAGRITTIEVGTLTLREIAAIRFSTDLTRVLGDDGIERMARRDFWVDVRSNGLDQAEKRDLAFEAFSERGGYPLVHKNPSAPWNEIANQLNETVIKRVIQHDLRVGDRGRKRDPALLEELFRLGCRYAGQAPSLTLFVREIQRALSANVGPQRVRHYLDFLDRALLLRSIRPLEIRLKKRHGDPKLCLADHGLRASWLAEVVPMAPASLAALPQMADLAGRIAESIVGAYFLTIDGLAIAHFPQRTDEPEVDFVLTVGPHRIPVEVKFRRSIDAMNDTEGLRSFIERRAYNAPFGILVTQDDSITVTDPRIIAVPLSSLLLMK